MALEWFMIGAFLIFVVFGFSMRSSFAETRNRQIEASDSLRQYLKFAKYNRGPCTGGEDCIGDIYGDELIAVIREYYTDPEFEIYIDRTSGNGEQMYVNALMAETNPSDYTVEHLQDIIPSLSRFHPYLVYNGVNPDLISTEQHGEIGNVTGIAFIWVTD